MFTVYLEADSSSIQVRLHSFSFTDDFLSVHSLKCVSLNLPELPDSNQNNEAGPQNHGAGFENERKTK